MPAAGFSPPLLDTKVDLRSLVHLMGSRPTFTIVPNDTGFSAKATVPRCPCLQGLPWGAATSPHHSNSGSAIVWSLVQ